MYLTSSSLASASSFSHWHGKHLRGGDLWTNPQVHGDGPRVHRGRQAQGRDPGGAGLEPESKSLGCPALEADKMDEPGDEDELLKEDVTSFRSVAARSNYLGMDLSRHLVRREGVVRDDVKADPKVVEATEAAGEVPCGQGGHDVGVQGGCPDGPD